MPIIDGDELGKSRLMPVELDVERADNDGQECQRPEA